MKISEIGEDSLIRRIQSRVTDFKQDGAVGIGDDCAVIPQTVDKSILMTTDLLTEDVHFLRSAIAPRDLGHKCLAVNLSDIAAMGGTPTAAFISMALPRGLDVEWVDQFFEGFLELAKRHDVQLLGGDTTASMSEITINVALMGEIAPGNVKLRSTAKNGDVVCVTGCLGDSAAGLKLVLGKGLKPFNAVEKTLVDLHHRPEPHVQIGQWLGKQTGVHAMMDVSDGLITDIRRLILASQCGVRISMEKLPVSQSLSQVAGQRGWMADELALEGGEDYCQLLTVAPEKFGILAKDFSEEFGQSLFDVGEITSVKNESIFLRNGEPIVFTKDGFSHF